MTERQREGVERQRIAQAEAENEASGPGVTIRSI